MGEMLNFPALTGFTGLLLGPKPISATAPVDNRIGILVGAANTAAAIVAEILSRYPTTNSAPWEPPVASWWISGTDGSLWVHSSLGTTSATWTPGIPSETFVVTMNIPTESLQAGAVVIVPGVAGKSIYPLGFALNYAAITGVGVVGLHLEDMAGTPILATTDTTLTAGTVYEFTSGVTLGAGFRAPLTAGSSLVLAVDGTKANFTCAGGVNVTVLFQIK
jgi:hypothetical protein